MHRLSSSIGKRIAVIGSISLLILSCGSVLGSKGKGKDNNSATAGEETVDVEIAIDQPVDAGLFLTATSVTYSGIVNGCKSGRTSTFNDASTTVKLLLGDSSCVARLTTISVVFSDNTTAEFTADSRYSFRAGTASVLAPNSTGLIRHSIRASPSISACLDTPLKAPPFDFSDVSVNTHPK